MHVKDIPVVNNITDFSILCTDSQNILSAIDKDLYTQSLAVVTTQRLNPSEAVKIKKPLEYDSFTINIIAENNCGRSMIAVLQTNLGALTFINGVARDILAVASIAPIGLEKKYFQRNGLLSSLFL